MNSARATGTKSRKRAAKPAGPVPVNASGNPPSALRPPSSALVPPSSALVPPSSAIAWLPALLQAGDSFYPTGGYAHSYGLEGLIQEGTVRDPVTLREFLLIVVLPSLRQTELALAAHAWRAFESADWDAVERVSRLASAVKAPAEIRRASENIGRQRAELLARLQPESLASDYLQRARDGAWPFATAVSAALEGCVHRAPPEAVLTALSYSSLAGLLSAAMKLLRLGQNGCQTLLSEALREIPAAVSHALAVPSDEIGWFNPWLDIASARHETAPARMFIS